MFEKEAKERARKLEESQTLGVYDNDEDYEYDSGWNEGEVAGYEEGFKDGAEFGYNKANEWHYVKDELPYEGTYLVVWQDNKGYKEIFTLNYEAEEYRKKLHWVDDDDYEIQDEYVIAWKEIVPPKENE